MSRRRALWIAGAVSGSLLVILLAAVLLLRSSWFDGFVRNRIVTTVETATGGRVELGGFRFDWTGLRADVRNFTLHGKEPSDKPPLFRAANVSVGLTIVSVLKRDVDVRYLEVREPRIYLIVFPDGRTNVPEPRVKRPDERGPLDSIVNLAIGRFDIRNGVFEIESRTRIPFDAHGRNLTAALAFDAVASAYRGNVAMRPLDVSWPGHEAVPVDADIQLALTRNRIAISSARFTTGETRLDVSGAIDDLRAAHGQFQYKAAVSIADARRISGVKLPERGTVDLSGNAIWAGGAEFSATGAMRAVVPFYRDSVVRLENARAESALEAGPRGVFLNGMRVNLEYVNQDRRVPVNGRVARVSIHGRDLDAAGVALSALDGEFRGEAHIRGLDRYSVNGEFSGIDARRTVAVYSTETLPWDGRVFGTVELAGAFRRKQDLRVSTAMTISPEPGSPPVNGRISATYDGQSRILDVGRSSLSLPSSRAEFSGAIGRQLRVHAETRDLLDFLPVIGQSAASVPLKFVNGSAVFDGVVTGSLDSPFVEGRLSVTNASYAGREIDSLRAAVAATASNLRISDASLVRGSARAQFQLEIGLDGWKPGDASQIYGRGAIPGARVEDLTPLIARTAIPITGTLNTSFQLAGTIGKPLVTSDLEVVKGALREEPFDRFTGRLIMRGRVLELSSGLVSAGAKQVRASATFEPEPDTFEKGRLKFQLASNAMPLEQVATVQQARPGVKGTVEVGAAGVIAFTPSPGGESFRIEDLTGELFARRLEMDGRPFGDAKLSATSQGRVLRVRLDSDFAGSMIQGDGQWRLEGDYPGSATVMFSRLDFTELNSWFRPSQSGAPDRFTGSAEGELRINGPALKPADITAELRVPKFEVSAGLTNARPAAGGNVLTLRNATPIVARMAKSVITVESARLVGRSTDLSLSGKVSLSQKSSLDLRVNGRADLGILQGIDRDLVASGRVIADAAIRGELDDPQVNGRMELQDAALTIGDLPNGISNARGLIVFSGDRATIQRLSGETGGGKIVLSGFASYTGGEVLFRLHARAQEVRVRYPEGVSTVADASLDLTGTADRSMLAGTVTVLRTGFNPQSDFSSVLAKSAEPVRTPAASGGLLAGLNFDIQIGTAPDIQFESSLTQDLQVEANLRLRGTASNPAVLGRISVTQGQLQFFGTRYNISQGSVSFYNAVKIEPILDVDLETKARGIDITLTVSGPLKDLRLTPRSDPPLQFNEIVALLATGRTPTSDPSQLAEATTTPQSWQQMGASALLGQAIASPVAGRLQRFFGVSKLRIDPTLPGMAYNPQARITLEQQVTREITFTYITDVTSSNPQVVRVDWSFSKQWSVVALREENGLFGLDFFFKRQFK